VHTVRVGVWNAQWAAPGTERGRETIRLLGSLACDVLCVTEVALGLLVPTGHVIDSEADYGYFASVIDAKSSSGADDRGRPSTE
jgi:hypothetical protein